MDDTALQPTMFGSTLPVVPLSPYLNPKPVVGPKYFMLSHGKHSTWWKTRLKIWRITLQKFRKKLDSNQLLDLNSKAFLPMLALTTIKRYEYDQSLQLVEPSEVFFSGCTISFQEDHLLYPLLWSTLYVCKSEKCNATPDCLRRVNVCATTLLCCQNKEDLNLITAA